MKDLKLNQKANFLAYALNRTLPDHLFTKEERQELIAEQVSLLKEFGFKSYEALAFEIFDHLPHHIDERAAEAIAREAMNEMIAARRRATGKASLVAA